MAHWAHPHKEAPAWPRRQQEQGKSMGKNLHGGFSRERIGKAGQVAEQAQDWIL